MTGKFVELGDSGATKLDGIRSVFREDYHYGHWLWRRIDHHVVIAYKNEPQDFHFLFRSAVERDEAYFRLIHLLPIDESEKDDAE